MASEIRVNKINSRTGVGTITLSPTGVDFTGIATVATLKATTGIVTTFSVTGNATVGGTLGVTGETTFATHINLGDSDKAKFGASGDLEIYHDGSHSYIQDNGTGAIKIKGDDLRVENAAGRNILKGTSTATELYFDNGSSSSKKFETTSSGIDVTGMVQCDQVRTGDDEKIQLGDSQDFRIYHDGSTNIIDGHYHPIELRHQSEVHAKFTDDGSVELYHNNSKKFETSSTGVTVTGNVAVTSGNGIDFSATGNGSGTMTSELLDDYEEGTWTPTTGDGTLSFSDAIYTKIGNMVQVSAFVYGFSNRTASSNLYFAGLPYVNAVSQACGNCFGKYISSDGEGNLCTYVSGSKIYIYETQNGDYLALEHNDLSSSDSAIYWFASYRTTV